MVDQRRGNMMSVKTAFLHCEAMYLTLQYRGVTVDMNKICSSSHSIYFLEIRDIKQKKNK